MENKRSSGEKRKKTALSVSFCRYPIFHFRVF